MSVSGWWLAWLEFAPTDCGLGQLGVAAEIQTHHRDGAPLILDWAQILIEVCRGQVTR